jgi:hypothetical protein
MASPSPSKNTTTTNSNNNDTTNNTNKDRSHLIEYISRLKTQLNNYTNTNTTTITNNNINSSQVTATTSDTATTTTTKPTQIIQEETATIRSSVIKRLSELLIDAERMTRGIATIDTINNTNNHTEQLNNHDDSLLLPPTITITKDVVVWLGYENYKVIPRKRRKLANNNNAAILPPPPPSNNLLSPTISTTSMENPASLLTCGEIKQEAARQFNINANEYMIASQTLQQQQQQQQHSRSRNNTLTGNNNTNNNTLNNTTTTTDHAESPPLGVVASDSIVLLPDWLTLPLDVTKLILLKKSSPTSLEDTILPSPPPPPPPPPVSAQSPFENQSKRNNNNNNNPATAPPTATHRFLPAYSTAAPPDIETILPNNLTWSDILPHLSYLIFTCLLIAWLLTINSQMGSTIVALHESVVRSLQKPFPSTFQGQRVVVIINQNVTTIQQTWDWIKGPLSELVVGIPTIGIPPPPPQQQQGEGVWWGTSPAYVDSWIVSNRAYRILSGIRLRQMRVISRPCTYGRPNSICYPPYSYSVSNTSSYGRSDAPYPAGFVWKSSEAIGPSQGGAPTIQGHCATYDPSGFVVDCMDKLSYISTLVELEHNGWIDEATRAIIVEFSIGTPLGVAASVRVLNERSTAGVVYASVECNAFQVMGATTPSTSTPSSSSCAGYHCTSPLAIEICLAIFCSLLFILRVIQWWNLITGDFSTNNKKKSTTISGLTKPSPTFLIPLQKPQTQPWSWNSSESWMFLFDFSFYIVYLTSLGMSVTAFSAVTSFNYESNEKYISLDVLHDNVNIILRFRVILVVAGVSRMFWLARFPSHSARYRVPGLVQQTFWWSMIWFLGSVMILIPIIISVLLVLRSVTSQNHFVEALLGGVVHSMVLPGFFGLGSSTNHSAMNGQGWTATVVLFVVCVVWVFVIPALIAGVILGYQYLSLVDRARRLKELDVVDSTAKTDPHNNNDGRGNNRR